jgi:large conductance mechanosensitive channel
MDEQHHAVVERPSAQRRAGEHALADVELRRLPRNRGYRGRDAHEMIDAEQSLAVVGHQQRSRTRHRHEGRRHQGSAHCSAPEIRATARRGGWYHGRPRRSRSQRDVIQAHRAGRRRRSGGPQMLKEFKEFAMRGNVLDMAVGIVIGAAFGTIVNSLVTDVIMPPVGLALGGVDFTNMFVTLRDGAKAAGPYASLAAAKDAGAVTLNYGLFVNSIVSFLIVAFAIFMVVKGANSLKQQQAEAPAAPPAPTADQKLLAEIRDLLKARVDASGQRVDVERVVAAVRLDAGLVHQPARHETAARHHRHVLLAVHRIGDGAVLNRAVERLLPQHASAHGVERAELVVEIAPEHQVAAGGQHGALPGARPW